MENLKVFDGFSFINGWFEASRWLSFGGSRPRASAFPSDLWLEVAMSGASSGEDSVRENEATKNWRWVPLLVLVSLLGASLEAKKSSFGTLEAC